MRQIPNPMITFFSVLVSILMVAVPVWAQEDIDYYTCGMHPSVKVSPQAYNKGDTKCPICHMPLTPVMKQAKQTETSDAMSAARLPNGQDRQDQHVISRVNIKDHELQRAGIQTEPVKKRHLFKEIRVVGTVAYDPKMAIAQDEYLSAVRTLEKIQEGQVSEITQRAESLVISSERKLRLLGLSEQQIRELKDERQVQTNLILPDKTVWIYGDVYEYELPWIKEDARVKVTSGSLPGEEFYGQISSINPVLDPQTRTLKFRALIDNPNLKLKPQMFVNIWISSHYIDMYDNHEVLSIPKNALLDTGSRQIVWVEKTQGSFEGREVTVGPLASVSGEQGQFYPVLNGLKDGESVVTSGNFLIDSQSQITGSAAASYGGALGDDNTQPRSSPAGHVH